MIRKALNEYPPAPLLQAAVYGYGTKNKTKP